MEASTTSRKNPCAGEILMLQTALIFAVGVAASCGPAMAAECHVRASGNLSERGQELDLNGDGEVTDCELRDFNGPDAVTLGDFLGGGLTVQEPQPPRPKQPKPWQDERVIAAYESVQWRGERCARIANLIVGEALRKAHEQ